MCGSSKPWGRREPTVNTSTEYHRRLQDCMRELREALPGPMAGFGQLHRSAVSPGALDSRTKELIALAIAVAVRCEGCVSFHVADALRAGASHQEIVEALGVAVLMGGGPGAVTAAEAMRVLEQFEAQPKAWRSRASSPDPAPVPSRGASDAEG